MNNIITNKREYIVTVKGTYRYMINEVVEFANGVKGLVIKSHVRGAEIALLSDDVSNPVSPGEFVSPTGKSFNLVTSTKMLGAIIDVDGTELFRIGNHGGNEDKYEWSRNIFEIARPIYSRSLVDDALYTGTSIIDWSIPIGKGQRELILGDRKTGKTSIALNMIMAQKDTNVKCVYVSIGQKKTTLDSVIKKIRSVGMEDRVAIVWTKTNDIATKKYLSPYIGMTIAEHLQKEYGEDVLIVFDDLSKHANAYREISLLFENAPTREAYPGDIFYLHSSLLERSGAYNEDFGSGSITAIPIVQTENGDISSFISTNVISITDGQIFTSKELFNAHQRPAINVPYSVSRIGSLVQSTIMKKNSGKIKLLISRFIEAEKMKRLSNFVSKENLKLINSGETLFRIIKQDESDINEYELSSLLLLLFQKGYMDFLKDNQTMLTFKTEMRKYLSTSSAGKRLAKILKKKERIEQDVVEVFLELEVLPVLKQLLLEMDPKISTNNSFKDKFGGIRNFFKKTSIDKEQVIIPSNNENDINLMEVQKEELVEEINNNKENKDKSEGDKND